MLSGNFSQLTLAEATSQCHLNDVLYVPRCCQYVPISYSGSSRKTLLLSFFQSDLRFQCSCVNKFGNPERLDVLIKKKSLLPFQLMGN